MRNKTLKSSKWLKVSQLKVGQRIAVPKEEVFDRSSPEIDYPVADIAESVEQQRTAEIEPAFGAKEQDIELNARAISALDRPKAEDTDLMWDEIVSIKRVG